MNCDQIFVCRSQRAERNKESVASWSPEVAHGMIFLINIPSLFCSMSIDEALFLSQAECNIKEGTRSTEGRTRRSTIEATTRAWMNEAHFSRARTVTDYRPLLRLLYGAM